MESHLTYVHFFFGRSRSVELARLPVREAGQSAVEIALMLPILLMLLSGIIIVTLNFFAFIRSAMPPAKAPVLERCIG